MSTEDSAEMSALRHEIDEVERKAVRTVELGPRGMVISLAVLVLIVGEMLPWMGGSNGFQVLLGQQDAAGRASIVPRLFAATSIGFGIFASALAVVTRRWALTWVCALGGWFASVDGVLAIWSRQSSAGPGASGPGLGLIIAEIATVVLASLWFRTAWSRS